MYVLNKISYDYNWNGKYTLGIRSYRELWTEVCDIL